MIYPSIQRQFLLTFENFQGSHDRAWKTRPGVVLIPIHWKQKKSFGNTKIFRGLQDVVSSKSVNGNIEILRGNSLHSTDCHWSQALLEYSLILLFWCCNSSFYTLSPELRALLHPIQNMIPNTIKQILTHSKMTGGDISVFHPLT